MDNSVTHRSSKSMDLPQELVIEKPGGDISRNMSGGTQKVHKKYGMIYQVQEPPPWYMCILFSFQHYLLIISGVALLLITTKRMCIGDDLVGQSEVIGTSFFVEGVTTLLQTFIGSRLPIIQGASLAYFIPTLAILGLPQWECPTQPGYLNGTELFDWRREVWTTRMRDIQGATIIVGVIQMVMGLTGVNGFLMRFLSPVCIATVMTLLGLAPLVTTARYSATHWGIALMCVALTTIFSQYMRNINVPFPGYKRGKGCVKVTYPIFKLIPVMLAVVITWLFCYILTVTNVFPDSPSEGYGYEARTDTKLGALSDAHWFRFPYPGQWGWPTFSVATVLGMMAGAFSGMFESLGDYRACAEMSGAPPPPSHAINRGVTVEGFGVLLGGLLGSAAGVTSYSGSIGAISITKVASRRVMQWCGIIALLLGLLGKFGAIFVAIPEPIIGGIFLSIFGIITAVGVSTLRFADMTSSRNLYIYGVSVLMGISVSVWMSSHPGAIKTGSVVADQVLSVMLSIAMVIGGVLSFFLDNTVPGTKKERGLLMWSGQGSTATGEGFSSEDIRIVYDLPYVMKWISRWRWTRFIPVCPTFTGIGCCPRWRRSAGLGKGEDDGVRSSDSSEKRGQGTYAKSSLPGPQVIIESTHL